MRVQAILICALLAHANQAGPAPAPGGARHELDVQGHRGCRGLMPENSMPAFERALELGVTTLEMDVQATADRVLVVHHDARLEPGRCFGPDGRKVRGAPLRSLTVAQLVGVDCGRKSNRSFPRQTRTTASIPRLAEVLELARGASYPVRVSIEIKLQDEKSLGPAEMADRVVAEVRAHGLVSRAIVQSFSPVALRAVGDLEPAISRAVLVRSRESYDRLLEESGAGILSPKYAGLTESDVQRMQARGVVVIPWTVNKPEAIRRMLDWGVDGIISDYPDVVLEILSEPETGDRQD
jgi:glycerophosphoryl diester phosphodiesterase